MKYKQESKTKRFRNSAKPFWDDQLTQLWYNVAEAESKYLQCPQHSHVRRRFRSEYLNQQNIFDSCYSKTMRNFERDKRKDIERLNTENPKEFWDAVHKLGLQKPNLIPVEIYDNSGEINTDTNFVLSE